MEVRYLKQPLKFIQSSEQGLILRIEKEIQKLQKDPFQNPLLKNHLQKMRSHHFFYKRNEYRIAYIIKGDLIIVVIGTRENFYKKL